MTYDISNQASYDYLEGFKNIILPAVIDPSDENLIYAPTVAFIEKILPIVNRAYNEATDYKILYRDLHLLIEQIAVNPNPNLLTDPYKEFHFDLFKTLFENDSGLHHAIHLNIGLSFDNSAPRHVIINKNLKRAGILKTKLAHTFAELPAMTGIRFDPLKDTNIPYVAFPRLGDDLNEPRILRLGQQTFRRTSQLIGSDELQPAFLNYLAVKHAEFPEKPIHHIYFNLMKRGLEVGESGFAKTYTRKTVEGPKTAALESINEMPLGAAVITLPADAPQFLAGFDKHKGRAQDPNTRFDLAELRSEILSSVLGNEHDFYIPPNVREILGNNFPDDLNHLFTQAIQAIIGNDPAVQVVNAQQRQAIIFEFVKYQLSRHIITMVNPDTVNFSCKDAIDRGGVHTLYYEVRNRLERGLAMSKDEFNTNLDAPALTVHHRPANENRTLLFNALRELYLANSEKFNKPEWGWMSRTLINNHPDGGIVRKLNKKVGALSAAEKDLIRRYHEEIGMITLATGYELNSSSDNDYTYSSSSPSSSSPDLPHADSPPYPSSEESPPSLETLSEEDDERTSLLFACKVASKHQKLSSTQIAQYALDPFIDLSKALASTAQQTVYHFVIDEDLELTQKKAYAIAINAVREVSPNTEFDLTECPSHHKMLIKMTLIKAIEKEGLDKHLTMADYSAKPKKR